MGKINLKDLYFDVVRTLQGEILVVEEPRAYFNYEEGIKKEQAGMDYICLCEGLKYEKQSIKVPGIMASQIEYQGRPIRVTCEGLEGKVWQDFNNKGEIKLTITAKSIAPIVEKTRFKMNVEDKS